MRVNNNFPIVEIGPGQIFLGIKKPINHYLIITKQRVARQYAHVHNIGFGKNSVLTTKEM